MLRQYIANATVFEPERVVAMSKAFDESCNALKIFAGDTHGREVIATRIIDLARRGVLDPETLHERVLFEARVPV